MVEQSERGEFPCCVALIDFDHFKDVNDSFGHAAGDRVLREFAGVASRTVRRGDIIARIGGEEFAILLRAATLEQASVVCERLRMTIADMTIGYESHTIRVAISGGVVAVNGEDATEILRMADAETYKAKREGRNRLSLAV